MNGNRKFLMALATCVTISFLVGVTVSQQQRKKSKRKSLPERVDLPTELNFPVGPKISEDVLPKEDTFIIQTSNGDVTVRNFFKGREKDVTSSGIEIVSTDAPPSDYSIYFDWKWKYFAITLQKRPIQRIREQAEQALLKQLDVSREDVCKLGVRLNILPGVGKFDGGKDYALSFCPNGIPFSNDLLAKEGSAKASNERLGQPRQRPAVYVEQGGCPFECCTYREWWTAIPTPIYASPNSSAARIRMLKKGEHVKALTGFVRTQAGEFMVTRNNGRYHVGDTIWVYSYRGEGFFLVWFKGKMYGEDMGFSPYGGSTGARCQDDPANCWGHLKDEVSSEWWIKLRLRDGRIGWTNQGSDYSNTDACG